MDQPDNSNHWRQMFDRDQRGGAQRAADSRPAAQPSPPPPSYDDGYDPAASSPPSLPPEAITDEAAMALALDAPDYRPWILQRGRTRPSLMLHLRRFDTRSRQWTGWAVAYPHLAAVEYQGSRLIALDFGTRHFMLEGEGLGELVERLQMGQVICVQEYAPSIWATPPTGPHILAIRMAE